MKTNWRISSATFTNNGNLTSGYYELEIVSTNNGTVTGGFTYRYRYMDSKTGELSSWVEATAAADTTATITLNLGGANPNTAVMTLKMPGGGATIQPGDKIVSVFDAASAQFNGSASGAGSLQIDNGPVLTYSAAGSLVKADNGDQVVDFNEIKYHMANLDPKTRF